MSAMRNTAGLRTASISLAIAAFLLAPRLAGAQTCAGDCDRGGRVGVDELITAVDIALGTAALDTCDAADRDGNGSVEIDELVTAVKSAIDGCPAVSTSTPTRTATATVTRSASTATSTPTVTPTPTITGTLTATPTATETPISDPNFRFLSPHEGEMVPLGNLFVEIALPADALPETLSLTLDGRPAALGAKPTNTPAVPESRTRVPTKTTPPTRTPPSGEGSSAVESSRQSATRSTRQVLGIAAGTASGYLGLQITAGTHVLDATVELDRNGSPSALTSVSFEAVAVVPPTDTPTPTATATQVPTIPTIAVLRRASKSGAVAVTDDQSRVVMVNPEDDSISIFLTGDDTLFAKVHTGGEPVAVVLHPDGDTAFVANRAEATVTKITGISDPSPVAVAETEVGSEPTSLALSPRGTMLFVAEFAEGRVSVLDTSTMQVVATIDAPANPRAVAVTNDGDLDETDETLIVTEFFGEPNPDLTACPNGTAEVCDTGRVGRVRRYRLSDFAPLSPILFSPIESGFTDVGVTSGTVAVMTSPNQLYAAAIQNDKVYVTSVSASPEPPIRFDRNVFPVVYVGDLTSGAEDRSENGSADLAKLAEDRIRPEESGQRRLFLQEIVDLDFDGDSDTAYVVSRASDAVQRVNYGGESGVTIGTEDTAQIDLAPLCQNPIGIAVASGLGRAYVNCGVTRSLSVIALDTQSPIDSVPSVDLPTEGSAADAVRLGERFFFTGRGRWSEGGEGYSSCGSCHPDGLSDGITWSFATGPRQTTALDGSFSHGAGAQKQRIFNWTAIFDEIHDFERNTRDVSGGLGAITVSDTDECGTLAKESRAAIPADGLGQPIKEIQDTVPGICTTNWDMVDAFVRTIRPPRGLRSLAADSVARGRALFAGDGACASCHAGAGWTVSRRFWTPSSANNDTLKITPFTAPTADAFWPLNDAQIGPQPADADTTGQPAPPNQVACVLRRVGTFGLPAGTAATAALERRATGARAQGAGGFNVPSLYGMAVGAPFFHHGQARNLHALLADPTWQAHLQSANPEFAPSEQQIDDLIDFILSIDATTEELPIPDGLDGCPSTFPTFRTHLEGSQEVPPVDSEATADATFFLSDDGTSLTYHIDVQGLAPDQILQAHLHVAPRGFNGPVVLFFTAGPPASLPLTGTLTAADLIPNPDVGVTDFASFVEALRAGDVYANIHTAAHTGGEIRGQIPVPTKFVADLAGSEEVPAVDTQATGSATFVLSADEQSLTYEVNVTGIDRANILQAHLHVAPRTFNGPVVLFFTAGPPAALPLRGTLTAADLIPNADAGAVDFASFVAALRAGDVYANVHTVAHAGGEIRGQVRGPATFPAALSGDQETTPVATGGSGRGQLVVSADRTSIRFALAASNLAGITQAHVHVAPPGFDGPVVLFLAHGPFTLRVGTLDADDLIPNEDAGVTTFEDFLEALEVGDAYMNIHTGAHPGGEVRGQIAAPLILPATLGGDQEVPPVDTAASGRARLALAADESALRFALEVKQLGQITEARLNVGALGENGPLAFVLSEASFNNPLVGRLGPDDLAGTVTFEQFIDALKAGNVYANVVTSGHPEGEIRGQYQVPIVFTAVLSGDQEVSPVTTNASGRGRLVLGAGRERMRFALDVDMLAPADITQAHIHVGPVGTNGDVAFFLAHSGFTSPLIGTLTPDDFITSPSAATFDDFLDALLAGGTYMNVHSTDHPGGEIRGQLGELVQVP